MQEKQEQTGATANNTSGENENAITPNPNPRANENIQNTSIDKSSPTDSVPDVGSEITDGEAS